MSGIDQSQKLKTIKTDDLNVDQPKETLREHAIPGQIKRDTAANIAGGKQVRKNAPVHLEHLFLSFE